MKKRLALIIVGTLIAGGLIWLLVTRNSKQPADETPSTPQAENPLGNATALPQIQNVASASTKGGTGPENPTPALAEPLIWEQAEYPERLTVADLDMPLIFEGAVSDELKQVILADLHLVFGHLTTHKTYKLRDSQRESYTYQDVEMWSESHVVFSGGNVYRPDQYDNVFGSVVQIGNQDHVVVPESLVAAYAKAWERKKANPEIYRKLEEFVDLMGEVWAGTAEAKDLPPTVADLFYPRTEEGAKALKEHSGGMETAGFLTTNAKGEGASWRMPSLLEIVEEDGGALPGIATGEKIFFAPDYYFEPDGRLKTGATPLVYINSRWKLLVGGP